jgi:quinoprotein glucose dehydrogenase
LFGFIITKMPFRKIVLACGFALALAVVVRAADEPFVETPRFPGGPPIDAELAIKQFKLPDGFKVSLFASEPQLVNPVSFCFDEQGRIFVAETFRYLRGVLDIRDNMQMYYDDLASRSVADRAAMIKHYAGSKTPLFSSESEVIRLIEDRAGTGKADHSTVYADGFNNMTDGIGAGVLARKGKLYYTCIPNLWMLEGTNQEGKATSRTSLSYGYGVHFGYSGHDLHGLRIGPDGKLYFSIGDRALNVTNKEGKVLSYTTHGSVLRCNLDGSELEVFATGLRNPQELAFDDHGNLFTGDNNCDHGDAARIVYVVEGGDTGWRNCYQFSETTPAGLWNTEKLWYLQYPGQAAYVLPPVAHMGNGPSGFAHYPGTGFPAAYNDHFFMCDFRGGSAFSGVHSFAVEPDGAGFNVVDHNKFWWGVLCTDCDFSPDGQFFVTDWVRGWGAPELGRIYRAYQPDLVKSPLVLETKKLIGEGMEKRPVAELEKLLGHADQRIRQEAQFELAARASTSPKAEEGQQAIDAFLRVAHDNTNTLPRLHAIWGLGQVGRVKNDAGKLIVPLLMDSDAEVRAQAAKVSGDDHIADAFRGLTNQLTDQNLRVRFFAAQSLGKLANSDAVKPLLAMLRANLDQDVFLRHAGVMGLLGSADKAALIDAGNSDWRSVRMAALLVMRRKQLPEISMFLKDPDPLIVVEAARAINDVPINEAMPALAALIEHPTANYQLDWRFVNANFRIGTDKTAAALAAYANSNEAGDEMRTEALRALMTWAKPFQRDRVTGAWQPLPDRDGRVAVEALRPGIGQLITGAPDAVRLMAIYVARELSMSDAATALFTTIKDTSAAAKLRVEALKGLELFHDPRVAEAVKIAVADADENVRNEGTRLQASLKPENAVAVIGNALEKGTIAEKQGALRMLGAVEGDAADNLIADWMSKLIAGTTPKEIQYELLQTATSHRASDKVKEKLREYQATLSKNDEFAGFRETLYGGDAAAGRKIFLERPDASCVRCHKIQGQGGEVGPELTGIANRHDREYILESILYPNKQIAPGFDSVLVQMNNGQSYAGVVKSQDADFLNIISVEDGGIVKLKKADIKSQVKGQSPMPEGMGSVLSKEDLRNLVEFLATLK